MKPGIKSIHVSVSLNSFQGATYFVWQPTQNYRLPVIHCVYQAQVWSTT